MQYIVVLAALAGCYSPGFRDCEIACGGGDCPSGLSCELGFCRVGGATQSCSEVLGDAGLDDVDADPSLDRDSDTVPDADDNCPDVPNRDQHDEDSDQLGDGCDPCPHLAPIPSTSSPAADSDGDGVGDACDPSPAVLGDRILMFEAFAAPGMLPSGAFTTGAAVSFMGDAAVTALTANESARVWWNLTLDPDARAHRITTRIHIDALATAAIASGAGALDVHDGSGNGVACRRGMTQNSPSQTLVSTSTDGTETLIATTLTTTVQGESTITLQNNALGTYTCSSDTTNSGNVPPGIVPVGAGIVARAAMVSFDYVLVIDSPRQ